MAIHIGSREARERFTHIIGQVHYGGQEVIVERSGRPMVAVIPVELYDRLVAEREARFAVVDRIRSRLPDVTADVVEKDVAAAVSAVRARRAARRP